MPTIVTHAFVGIALSQASPTSIPKIKALLILLVISILPDLDVIAFTLGIPYSHPLGHRGILHSIPFCFLVSFLACLIFLPNSIRLSKDWVMFWGLCLFAAILHCVLDMATDGGLGIGLFLPFIDQRYVFKFRPIPAAYISPKHFFTDPRTLYVLLAEFVWIWIPLLIFTLVRRIWKRNHNNML